MIEDQLLEDLTRKYGSITPFTTPSGMVVCLRELTGEDETVISNYELNRQQKALVMYVSTIVVAYDGKVGNPTFEEAMKWRSRDKYAILVMSRCTNISTDLRFTYKWPDLKNPTTYLEDLNRYIWDYSKEFPTDESDPNYDSERIAPYPGDSTGPARVIELSSGKKVRYLYSNGLTEQYMLDLADIDKHRHSELYARQLELEVDKKFIRVENLKSFSTKDTREIWDDINKVDKTYNLVTEIVHPKTKEVVYMPIVGIQDFFFPEGI